VTVQPEASAVADGNEVAASDVTKFLRLRRIGLSFLCSNIFATLPTTVDEGGFKLSEGWTAETPLPAELLIPMVEIPPSFLQEFVLVVVVVGSIGLFIAHDCDGGLFDLLSLSGFVFLASSSSFFANFPTDDARCRLWMIPGGSLAIEGLEAILVSCILLLLPFL